MDPRISSALAINRRQFFGRTAVGIGTAALASLLAKDGFGAAGESASGGQARVDASTVPPGGLSFPNFAPKAKRVIYIMQSGGPPHVDMFDYKPKLKDYAGKDLPKSVQMGQRLSTMTQGQQQLVLPGITPWSQCGKNGTWLSDWLPHTQSIVDDIC